MAGWAVSMVLFAATWNPLLLVPERVLFGIGWIAAYSMAVAHLGDVVTPREAGIAFGMLTTSMGAGFTLGPLLGTVVTAWRGIRASYLVGSAVLLAGAAVAAGALRPVRSPHARAVVSSGIRPVAIDRHRLLEMLRTPSLAAASIANLMINLSFGAAVVTFFPLYAAALHVPQAATNSMFSMRALASTISRIPAGAVVSRFSSWIVLIVALALLGAVLLSMGHERRIYALALLLVLEGIAYGIILTSAQALTADKSVAMARGGAIGLYSLAGSLGGGIGPVMLGVVAQLWGIRAVFNTAGIMVAAGLLATAYMRSRSAGARPVIATTEVY
jgi:MFS family permease